MKGRFTVNPFQELSLTSNDRTSLEDLANRSILINLELCMKYMSGSKRNVDSYHWKLLKEKEKLKVYKERPEGAAAAAASGDEATGMGLPMLLCVGNIEGKLEDLLFGVISEDLETMRVKASRRLGDFGKSNSTCKICFGFVCHACKIVRKLSFVDPDLLLSQRRVTFCTVCISSATSMSSIDCAHARILKHGTMDRSSAVQKSSFEDDSEE
ncbi:unnamed protein product [Peronospora destructor]|uniref:Uncharacterized protein n=1 Tax=Peronospora destructor TaxID=86335 RepID=A0AAV0TNG6_9STRA|nr:unnamed protein product [Peronospora destructor]